MDVFSCLSEVPFTEGKGMVILYFIFAAIRYLSNLITYIRGISRREVLRSGRASTAWKCVRTPPWGSVLRTLKGVFSGRIRSEGKVTMEWLFFLGFVPGRMRGPRIPFAERKGMVIYFIFATMRDLSNLGNLH